MSDCFDSRKDVPVIRRANAAYIATLAEELLPPLRLAARGAGYALAVHGTMARDIDLIAVAWTENASDADYLLGQLKGVIAGVTGRALTQSGGWTKKPHGRLAQTIIHAGHDAEIDLSVIPPTTSPTQSVETREDRV